MTKQVAGIEGETQGYVASRRFRPKASSRSSIDHVSWRDSFAFESHGARIGIRTTEAGVLSRLIEHLPPGWQSVSHLHVHELYSLFADGDTCHLYLGSEKLSHACNLELVLDRLFSDIHHRIALHATSGLFVHSGVVSWQGQAILLPGKSHSGKSTLISALLSTGATYYSDEYAVITADGQVAPYPKLLSLREGGEVRHFYPPSRFHAESGRFAVPIQLVALLQYEQGAIWNPQPLSRGQVLLALLANTLVARDRPAFALLRLSSAIREAAAIQGSRDDAELVVQDLLRIAAQSSDRHSG